MGVFSTSVKQDGWRIIFQEQDKQYITLDNRLVLLYTVCEEEGEDEDYHK